ncbi:MAG: hypothetical protein ISR77_06075 [Pirellulaceae bacterium]|nr:hypothetical protein [Pirellulaceae bacterium]
MAQPRILKPLPVVSFIQGSAWVSDPAARRTAGLRFPGETYGRSLWLGRETGHNGPLTGHNGVLKPLPVISFILVTWTTVASQLPAADALVKQPRLCAAALQFGIAPEPNAATASRTGARARRVVGPLKTTVVLLDGGATRLCLVTTHFGGTTRADVCELFRKTIARDLQLPVSHVLLWTSHNHSSVSFSGKRVSAYETQDKNVPPAELLPIGEKFLDEVRSHAKRLPEMLQPVTVWWAEGRERRITYNRKGRRADGTTYFMREEDRVLVGDDFNGDIDTQAPVVVLKNATGQVVAALAQFTGHPVTSYHPEKPVVFGEWPQVACDLLAAHFDKTGNTPVSFLQGCAGDVNSKEMFCGGVERSAEFGRMLGQSYIAALPKLRPSRRDGLDFAMEKVNVPLAPLPSAKVLIAELNEMDDFIRRANSGDEDTLSCVGLNFPRALTPAYRGRLVELIRPWNQWALGRHEQGRADSVPKHLDMEIGVIRIGDIGIVGMPCEPFQGIGRQIRRHSPLRVSIPCAYMNASHGYITDGPNTGDREYMSAFYRYTKFRPPLEKPAGDVMAERAVEVLSRFAKETALRASN